MNKLYIVATPIGNLKDITFRAVETLNAVDFVYAEDTRRAKILLDHYQIKTSVDSYHQHSGGEGKIAELIRSGKSVAYISDAGTPGISDPGQKLIAVALSNNIEVEAIPGVSAVAAALSIAGVPTDKFYFRGFLPNKKGRKTALENLKSKKETIALYESPYRIIKTLEDIKSILGDREAVVARELTKKFETIYRGKISQIIAQIKPKGEFVVIIKGEK